MMLPSARIWDPRTANGVDHFIANSSYIARRIRKVYGREATVIHPPVDIDAFPMREDKEDFYLCAARMVPYKRGGVVVDAFAQMPDKRLVVSGDGPEMPAIRARATPNVTLLGYVSGDVLRDHMQQARAFVFAAEEDFGITMVEALACGTPVICLGRGGARDILASDEASRCGLFFKEADPDDIADAIRLFCMQHDRWDARACRARSKFFGPERFAASVEKIAGTA